MSERNLVAVSIKHTEYRWKFGMPMWLWGHRTKDDEKRSFGGYTQYPNNAEVYSLEDWAKSGYNNCNWMKLDEPVQLCINFCKNTSSMILYLFRWSSTSDIASVLVCRWIDRRKHNNGC